MTNPINITVAVCTFNRSHILDQTLRAFAQVVPPENATWELIVVDNNSTDDTPSVLNGHLKQNKLPLRILLEPKQGHCNARNCAIRSSTGEFIVWTDDDVIVPPDWLRHYWQAFSLWPNAAYFGGPIHPWFSIPVSGWLAELVDAWGDLWALIDHGGETRPLLDGEQVYGANMAFPKWVMEKYPFDPNRGHVGNRLMGGDETTVINTLRKTGHYGVWVGQSKVDHYIPRDRLNKDYVYRRVRDSALLDSRTRDQERCTSILGLPRYAVKKLLTHQLLAFVLSPTKSSRWLKHYLLAAQYRGIIDAAIVARRANRK